MRGARLAIAEDSACRPWHSAQKKTGASAPVPVKIQPAAYFPRLPNLYTTPTEPANSFCCEKP